MAKQQSLAAKTDGALAAPALTLPAIFTKPPEAMKARYMAPYIVFAHPKRADEWKRINSRFKDVEEGDMFLLANGEIYKTDTLKCSLLAGQQYWSEANAAGVVLKTSYVELPKPYKEQVEAVLLVYHGDGILVANVHARGPKCSGFRGLVAALIEASESSWGDKGAEFKESLIVNQPFGRFYANLVLGDKRTGKTSGLPYKPLTCEVHPTGIPEWRMFDAFCKSEEATKQMNDAAVRFSERMVEVDELLVK